MAVDAVSAGPNLVIAVGEGSLSCGDVAGCRHWRCHLDDRTRRCWLCAGRAAAGHVSIAAVRAVVCGCPARMLESCDAERFLRVTVKRNVAVAWWAYSAAIGEDVASVGCLRRQDAGFRRPGHRERVQPC